MSRVGSSSACSRHVFASDARMRPAANFNDGLKLNALLPEPNFAGANRGNTVGRAALGLAAFSLPDSPQRGRRGHGAGLELVAGTESDSMVEAIKIWAGIRRQS